MKTTRLWLMSMLLGSVLLLAGCNTMEGMGEDFASLGRAIQGEAAEEQAEDIQTAEAETEAEVETAEAPQ